MLENQREKKLKKNLSNKYAGAGNDQTTFPELKSSLLGVDTAPTRGHTRIFSAYS